MPNLCAPCVGGEYPKECHLAGLQTVDVSNLVVIRPAVFHALSQLGNRRQILTTRSELTIPPTPEPQLIRERLKPAVERTFLMSVTSHWRLPMTIRDAAVFIFGQCRPEPVNVRKM